MKFMTYNLYLGADINDIFLPHTSEACGDDATSNACIASKVDDILLPTLFETNFAERAANIASIIKKEKPIAIGLQEVAKIVNLSDPTILNIDFLQIFMAALANEGLGYDVVVGLQKEVALVFPSETYGPYIAASPTGDVLLVRKGFETRKTSQGIYSAFLSLPPLVPKFERGWVATEIEILPDTWVRVINTHLETRQNGPINIDQATELVAQFPVNEATIPTIKFGDINAPVGTLADEVITSAGYVDTWLANNQVESEDGLTCCQNKNLSNEESSLYQRIDYVYASSGHFQVKNSKVVGNKLAKGVVKWNSDHAGVVSTVELLV